MSCLTKRSKSPKGVFHGRETQTWKVRLPELTATHSPLSQLSLRLDCFIFFALSLSGFAERSVTNRARNTTARIKRSTTRTMRTISSRVRSLLLNLILCFQTSISPSSSPYWRVNLVLCIPPQKLIFHNIN